VPLQLHSTKTSGDKFILWQNCRPSVRSCKPIWIQFKKETAEIATEETSAVEERIKKLEKSVINSEKQNSVIF
jgi:hypothetical protein